MTGTLPYMRVYLDSAGDARTDDPVAGDVGAYVAWRLRRAPALTHALACGGRWDAQLQVTYTCSHFIYPVNIHFISS